ncbi:protein 5NUC-like [Dermacentor silvarum]|uniref:protein 5NUC-like n=1 Tax=Dermacentor silvarum TaxID=543639 RepID=UPI0021011413|nr:protein 5NUC-like [Dermacentor silvarum]
MRVFSVGHLSVLCMYLGIIDANGDRLTTVTILHTNDIHSRILESDKSGRECKDGKSKFGPCYGGIARIHNAVRRLKAAAQNPLFLNAGDFYQGTLWYSILKHEIVSAAMSKMLYNVVCLGNHEFDDGPEGLAPFLWKMKQAHVTVLGTNLDYSDEPLFRNITLPKSIVYTIAGLQVALLGVVTTETLTIARPGRIRILPEVKSINDEIERLKQQGVKTFFLISHVGYDVDRTIAKECPDLDLIVGGHTNTLLYTGVPPVGGKAEGPYPYVHKRSDGSSCLIVQAYRYGTYLGFLQLGIDPQGKIIRWSGNPILLSQGEEEE